MTPPACTVEGCEKPAHARGLCKTHYARQLRTGSTKAHVPVGELQQGRQVKRCECCGQILKE